MRVSDLGNRLRRFAGGGASQTPEREPAPADVQVAENGCAVKARAAEHQPWRQAFFANNADAIWQIECQEPIPVDLPFEEFVEKFYRCGRLAGCNDAYARLKARQKAEELIGASVDALMPRGDPHRFEQMRLILRAALRNETVDLTDGIPGGRMSYRVVTATPIVENGSMVELWGSSCDVTRLKQAETALRESDRRYRTLFDSAQDALLVLRDERIIECNPKCEEIFGLPAAGIVGRSPYELSPPRQPDGRDSPHAAREYMARAIGGEPQFFEWRHVKANGAPFDAEVCLNPVQLADAIHVQAAIRDITERKQRERELRELKARLETENIQLREVIHVEQRAHRLVGESAAMRRVLEDVRTVGPTNATVLILGETGTGKELVAHAVHDASPLEDKPLITVNCAALTPSLIETEFFGYEKGAFTGAIGRKRGRFELADGGTIFLDEVGDLPMDLQAKLLRVLQCGEFERVGGMETLRVSTRIIAATNRNLEDAVRAGTFRADLYYRLNVFPILVPPLRQRRSDIPALVQYCLGNLSRSLGKPLTAVTPGSMDQLMSHEWPGNVRELLHVLERAAIRTVGTVVEVKELEGAYPRTTPAPVPLSRLEDVERAHILDALRDTNWVIEGPRGAAARVGLHPNTLRYRMRKLNIERPPRL